MFKFPQELIDMVIDELAEALSLEFPDRPSTISNYSTVSKQWVKRTQQHHFRVLSISSQNHLQKWSENTTSSPSPIPSYVRKLSLHFVDTFEGFGDCLKAFTRVTAATFCFCDCFRSLDSVRPLMSWASTLVDLEIAMDSGDDKPPSEVIVSFLAALPRLRYFHAQNLSTAPPKDPDAPLPTIPFFEGENEFELLFDEGYPDAFWWIPETARFGKLTLGLSCLETSPQVDFANKWIASSGPRLKGLHLKYEGVPGEECFSPILPLDLSGCPSLETLEFPVPLLEPGYVGDNVLRSISSSNLSTVSLDMTLGFEPVEFEGWDTVENELCRLAKLGGGKMAVDIEVFKVPNFSKKYPLPKLKEEARRIDVEFHDFDPERCWVVGGIILNIVADYEESGSRSVP